jgi:hypothetical protein
MDEIINFEVITEMLANPPSLDPRPNFFRLRALRKHIADVVGQLPHPTYPQHGWKGMIIQPTIFNLINQIPFVPPVDPGPIPVYGQFALLAETKMVDN